MIILQEKYNLAHQNVIPVLKIKINVQAVNKELIY